MCPHEKPDLDLAEEREENQAELMAVTSTAKLDNQQKLLSDPVDSTAEVLTSAPPPWHSVGVLGLITAFFVPQLPSWSQIDEIATLSTFARTEAWIGNPWNLGLIRLLIAASIWATTIHVLCGPGWTVATKYKPHTKLKRNTIIRMKGIKTMFPFTSWSWNILGLSYSLNALIALSVATGNDRWITELPHNWLLRLALIAWEIAAPCAILVSTVIRYAIWEMCLKSTGDTSNLKSFRNMMMHNANAFFVIAEVGLLGGLPVRFSEVSFAPLFGVCYVLFSWFMSRRGRWTEPENGPQFIYFFFDTTLGKTTSLSLLALLFTLLLFHVLFAYARSVLDTLSVMVGGVKDTAWQEEMAYSPIVLGGHVYFVLMFSSAVCRFRD